MAGWRDFTELKVALRALSSATSLNVLHQLAGQGEITVTEVAAALEISQPLVSWHLRNLRRVGLARTRRQGREVYCSLDTERFNACLHALRDLVAPTGHAQAPPAAPPDGEASAARTTRPAIAGKAADGHHPPASAPEPAPS